MKLPPMRTLSSEPRMVDSLRQSHAAGGLSGLFCTASSRMEVGGRACAGVDVSVKPPALGREGMKTSSHWPGANYYHEIAASVAILSSRRLYVR